MSKAEKKEKIESLLKKLRKAEDDSEKRSLRTKLRTLGHTGGLGEGAGRPKGSGKKKSKSKKDRDEDDSDDDE